jgi:hypothetical protein
MLDSSAVHMQLARCKFPAETAHSGYQESKRAAPGQTLPNAALKYCRSAMLLSPGQAHAVPGFVEIRTHTRQQYCTTVPAAIGAHTYG